MSAPPRDVAIWPSATRPRRPDYRSACGPSRSPRSWLWPRIALAKRGLSSVRHLHPLGVRRGIGDVTFVPVPPLVRPALRIPLRRILPRLLAPKRRHVEVAPDGAHRLVAAAVDEIAAEHAIPLADERVVAVPLIHTEVDVESVGDGGPG